MLKKILKKILSKKEASMAFFIDDKRTCQAIGCAIKPKGDRIFCSGHWHDVPYAYRVSLVDAVVKLSDGRYAILEKEFVIAAKKVIAYLARLEGRAQPA